MAELTVRLTHRAQKPRTVIEISSDDDDGETTPVTKGKGR